MPSLDDLKIKLKELAALYKEIIANKTTEFTITDTNITPKPIGTFYITTWVNADGTLTTRLEWASTSGNKIYFYELQGDVPIRTTVQIPPKNIQDALFKMLVANNKITHRQYKNQQESDADNVPALAGRSNNGAWYVTITYPNKPQNKLKDTPIIDTPKLDTTVVVEEPKLDTTVVVDEPKPTVYYDIYILDGTPTSKQEGAKTTWTVKRTISKVLKTENSAPVIKYSNIYQQELKDRKPVFIEVSNGKTSSALPSTSKNAGAYTLAKIKEKLEKETDGKYTDTLNWEFSVPKITRPVPPVPVPGYNLEPLGYWIPDQYPNQLIDLLKWLKENPDYEVTIIVDALGFDKKNNVIVPFDPTPAWDKIIPNINPTTKNETKLSYGKRTDNTLNFIRTSILGANNLGFAGEVIPSLDKRVSTRRGDINQYSTRVEYKVAK